MSLAKSASDPKEPSGPSFQSPSPQPSLSSQLPPPPLLRPKPFTPPPSAPPTPVDLEVSAATCARPGHRECLRIFRPRKSLMLKFPLINIFRPRKSRSGQR